MDFKNLKKNQNSLDRLTKALEEQNKSKSFKDDTEGYWAPKRDKAGNAFAEIRFLPAPAVDGEEGLPWVHYFQYGFQGPGGWYVNRSLVSIGKADPAAEQYYAYRNSGQESRAKQINRSQYYVSHVYVIQDTAQPEAVGKVFKFKYGKKIFSKIEEKMHPTFPGEVGFDPFDFWHGANFKLKVKTIVDGDKKFPNYDNSEFSAQSVFLGGDDKTLEEIWKSMPSLAEVNHESNYGTYDDLKKQLDKALGNEPLHNDGPKEEVATTKKPTIEDKHPDTKSVTPPWEDSVVDDDDEMLKKFQDLADKE